MATMFPGEGQPLYNATYDGTTPALTTFSGGQPVAAIANGGYTSSVPLNPALGVTLSIVWGTTAPTVATEIHLGSDPTFAKYFVVATLPISSDKYAIWTSLERLVGHLRVKNTSGQDISSVKVQMTAAMYGG